MRGHPSSAREMTALVRSRATIVNLGVFKKPVEVDMQAVNFKEIEILGSRVYERKIFRELSTCPCSFLSTESCPTSILSRTLVLHSSNLSRVHRARCLSCRYRSASEPDQSRTRRSAHRTTRAHVGVPDSTCGDGVTKVAHAYLTASEPL